MSDAISFTVPGAFPPSGNELRRKYRHWAAYARLRDQWADWIHDAALIIERERPDFPEITSRPSDKRDRRKVSVQICHSRVRRLDDDNLSSGLKPVYDALRLAGFIVNDSPRWMDQVKPTQSRTKDPKQVGTTITIEPLEPPRQRTEITVRAK